MDFMKSIGIAASGLKTQSGRMRVIAENIANADSVADKPGVAPYRRKIVTFDRHMDRELEAQVVTPGRIVRDTQPFRTRYEPGHPAADAKGDVQLPNVNTTIEMMDMREAQRSYEASLNVISATRRMLQRTIDLLRT